MSIGAVVVGAHVNALGVIRQLGARGVPVAAISTRPFDIAQHSRFVVERHSLPELHERLDSLPEFLDHRASSWPGWAVFPTNDDAMTALSQYHERLSRTYRLTVQPWDILSHLVDKDLMHELARRAGLDVPTCHGMATEALLSSADLRFPVVVKPIRHDKLINQTGAKAFVARDTTELREAIHTLDDVGLEGLVWDFVEGPDANLVAYCVYVDDRGEASPGVTVRKLRQHPPVIGGARVAETIADVPGMRDATLRLLREARFRGPAVAEFKIDPRSGHPIFIEVNCRSVLFNSLPARAGLDLVSMTWDDFVEGTPPRARLNGWQGAWIHLLSDLRGSLAYRRVERLGIRALIRPYLGPKIFAVASARDPKPFLAQIANGLGLTARRR